MEEDKSQPLPLMRQVQIAAGVLILLGVALGYAVNSGFLLSAFVGAGLAFAGITGFCGMARLLALMPGIVVNPYLFRSAVDNAFAELWLLSAMIFISTQEKKYVYSR